MSTGPRFGWGGKRLNQTGRPRVFSATEVQVRKMLREAKKIAKEEGKTIDRLLLEMIYDKEYVVLKNRHGEKVALPRVDEKTRVTAIKVFKEFTMQRQTEQNVKIEDNRGPGIMLPEMMPDPAKEKFPKEGNA
jgi:DNA polymerase III delta prime subunit